MKKIQNLNDQIVHGITHEITNEDVSGISDKLKDETIVDSDLHNSIKSILKVTFVKKKRKKK